MIMLYEDVYAQIVRGTAADTLPRWALGILNAVATGERQVRAIRHPLGFLCLPVERTGRLGVCLHLWSPLLAPAATTTSQVHCHSWDLVSFILYGRVSNVLASIGEGSTHRVFEVVSHGEVDEIRATERTVAYVPGVASTQLAGDVYTLPAGVFHSTVIGEGQEAATIALGLAGPGGPRTAAGDTAMGTDLSLGPLTTPTHRVGRQRCDAAETARTARLSAKRLAAAQAA